MKRLSFIAFLFSAALFPSLLGSCSHKYDPDNLDLAFYQWNLWYDTSDREGLQGPSCGWEEFSRGMGKLVRIPAMAADHFQEQDGGVLWFHCRFTLPENWEERRIGLEIRGAAPLVEIFLNEEPIAEFTGMENLFAMDVSDRIFYTRDNHLALKIRFPAGSDWTTAGVSEGIEVRSFPENITNGKLVE